MDEIKISVSGKRGAGASGLGFAIADHLESEVFGFTLCPEAIAVNAISLQGELLGKPVKIHIYTEIE